MNKEWKHFCESQWQTLCEFDDRTSPEEYPDHALITKEELERFMEKSLEFCRNKLTDILETAI